LNVNKLNITYLNVCGISSKLLNPNFETLINNYDILVLVETKTDEYDNIKLPKNVYDCLMCCPSYAWRLLDLDAQHGFHRTDDHLQKSGHIPMMRAYHVSGAPSFSDKGFVADL
jgi:hypothetical protein